MASLQDLQSRIAPPLAGAEGAPLPAPEETVGPTSAVEQLRRRREALRAGTTSQGPGTGIAPFPGGVWGMTQAAGQRLAGSDVPPGDYEMEAVRNSLVAGLGAAGAIAGGKAGFLAGGGPVGSPAAIATTPIGSLIGGAAGVAGATFAPEASLWAAEKLGVIEPGTAEKWGARRKEELNRMAVGESALDLHFGVLSHLPRAIARPLARAFSRPGARVENAAGKKEMSGQELAKEAQEKLNITLMPWQVGKGSIARGILTVAGRFPIVGAPARGPVFGHKFGWRGVSGQLKSEKDAIRAAESIPVKIGEVKTMPDLSRVIMSEAMGLHERFQKHFGKRYQEIWDLAEEVGVRVNLSHTHAKAAEILTTLRDRAPKTVGGDPLIGKTRTSLIDFLRDMVNPLSPTLKLRELDTLVSEIDDFVSQVEPKQYRFVLSQLNDLREAALRDFQESLIELPRHGVGPGGLPTTTMRDPSTLFPGERMGMGGPSAGPSMETIQTGAGAYEALNAKGIAQKIREIDAEYSAVMSTIFETSTAKKFGRVVNRGLRGHTWDPSTATGIGKLAEITLDLGDRQAVSELFGLVSKETRKDLTATILERGLAESWEEVPTGMGGTGRKFDTEKFAKYFGLTPGTRARHDALDEMLKRSGMAVSSEDIRLLGKAMEAIALSALPSASTFIARRAQIGGGRAIVAGLMGGLAGGSAGSMTGDASLGLSGAAVGMLISFVGVRGVIRAISNPAGAKALRHAIKEENSLAVRRANVMRFTTAALDAAIEDAKENLDPNGLKQLEEMSSDFKGALEMELRAGEAEERRRRVERAIGVRPKVE